MTFRKLLSLLFVWASVTLHAKQYVYIHPYGNMYQIIWHDFSDAGSTPAYCFTPHLSNGQAFRFSTIVTEDTAGIAKRYPASPSPNPEPFLMELVGIWDLPDTPAKNTDEDRFGKFVSGLIGKDFIKVRVVYPDKPNDNITPYRYKGKRCMLLWDTPIKCVELGNADRYLSWWVFDFDYSLSDAKQIALCQYTDEQYVLLLLTDKAIFEK